MPPGGVHGPAGPPRRRYRVRVRRRSARWWPVVAGQHRDLDAEVVEAVDRLLRAGADCVGDGDQPPAWPSAATRTMVRPASSSSSARDQGPSRSIARSRMSFALPTRTPRPSTAASSPWPGTALKPVASTSASWRSFAASPTARASGCSLEPSAEAASRRTSSSLTGFARAHQLDDPRRPTACRLRACHANQAHGPPTEAVGSDQRDLWRVLGRHLGSLGLGEPAANCRE